MDNKYYLSFKNLFGYLDASPTSRCINAGEAIINAGHLITCGILNQTATLITIFALCLKTSALLEKPHEIRGSLKLVNEEVQVGEFACSCKGGLSGRCKHIAGVLILCSRNNILDLPVISSTDLACYWKKSDATGIYKAAPLLNHQCFAEKVVPSPVPIKPIDSEAITRLIMNTIPDSAFAKHRNGRKENIEEETTMLNCKDLYLDEIFKNCNDSMINNLAPVCIVNNCCKTTYENISQVDVMEIAIQTKNDEQKWFKERQFRITGSRCYAIFTYSLSDWEMKAQKYFWPKKFSNKYTEHGKKFETVARNKYCESNGSVVAQTGLIINKNHPWLGYSPDGVIIENGKVVKLLEIKCPFEGRNAPIANCMASCNYLMFDGVISLKKKHQYYAQVQLGMALLNLNECHLVIFASFDSSFINVIVKYDEDFSRKLIHRLQYNYFNKMLHVICTNK